MGAARRGIPPAHRESHPAAGTEKGPVEAAADESKKPAKQIAHREQVVRQASRGQSGDRERCSFASSSAGALARTEPTWARSSDVSMETSTETGHCARASPAREERSKGRGRGLSTGHALPDSPAPGPPAVGQVLGTRWPCTRGLFQTCSPRHTCPACLGLCGRSGAFPRAQEARACHSQCGSPQILRACGPSSGLPSFSVRPGVRASLHGCPGRPPPGPGEKVPEEWT